MVSGSGHVHVYLVRYVKHQMFLSVFVLGCIWTQFDNVSTGEMCRLTPWRQGRSVVDIGVCKLTQCSQEICRLKQCRQGRYVV